MKRIIFLISVLVLSLGCIFNSVYAENITLEQIADKFNIGSLVESYKGAGGSVKATSVSDGIEVDLSINDVTENVKFLLDGNFLYSDASKEDESGFTKMFLFLYVADAYGELIGYDTGELAKTINSEEAQNYTLENEGFEIKDIDEKTSRISIDISKKIPLVDFSDTYIKVSDMKNIREYISGDGSTQMQIGNVWFNKSGYDGENTVLIAEEGALSDNAYKSLLSIIEVMFDNSEVVEFFKDNYYGFYYGDAEFEGFSIKVDPKDKTEWEEEIIPSDSEYEFARIIINKELAISGTTNLDNNYNENVDLDEDISLYENVQKKESVIMWYAIIGVLIIGVTIFFMLKKK